MKVSTHACYINVFLIYIYIYKLYIKNQSVSFVARWFDFF